MSKTTFIINGVDVLAENAKMKEKLETLQDEIGHFQQVLLQIKDIAMCGDCEQDCDHCMQGQIHQLIDKCLAKERQL